MSRTKGTPTLSMYDCEYQPNIYAWRSPLRINESVENLLQYTKALIPVINMSVISQLSTIVNYVPKPTPLVTLFPESESIELINIIAIAFVILDPIIFEPMNSLINKF